MLKIHLALIVLTLIVGCNNMPTGSTEPRIVDSLKHTRQPDNVKNDPVYNALFDTIGVSAAPVQVLSAKMVERETSSYKDIRLSWKNVSGKKVAAIRFSWYGLNAFGEPAEMGGNIARGFGTGLVDRPLGAGKTDFGTWSIMSSDGKKVVFAWPFEVAFEDGTKWKTQ